MNLSLKHKLMLQSLSPLAFLTIVHHTIYYCRCAAAQHSSHAWGIPALCRTAGVSMQIILVVSSFKLIFHDKILYA